MKNSFSVVEEFERRVADLAGAKHGIAVDCCTNGIFLSLKYRQFIGQIKAGDSIVVPAKTYVSVPMAVIHAGMRVEFKNFKWTGVYPLKPADVVDGAKRFRCGMYRGGLHCLSFHAKKHIPIGRGGMVLTDSDDAAEWLRVARYDGRQGKPYHMEKISMMGWHCYMTPEQAARGLLLLDIMPGDFDDLTEDYPDLRKMPVFA